MSKESKIIENGVKIAVGRLTRTNQTFEQLAKTQKHPGIQAFYRHLAESALENINYLLEKFSSSLKPNDPVKGH